LLVAATVTVPAEGGAVNSPLALTLPAEAVQVTDVLLVVPWTVSANWIVLPAWSLGFVGDIVTPVTPVEVGWTATPVRAIRVGELGVLLASNTLPVSDPTAVGENVTLKLLLWPGGRLSGRASPETLKPVPVTLACVMLNVAAPVLVTVTCCDWLLPTLTAKLAPVGLTASWDVVEVEPAPVPVTLMVFIPPEVRSRVKERLPEKVLAESGRKDAWNVALFPTATVVGREGPVRANSGRLAEAWRIVILWWPEFVSRMVLAEVVVLTLTDPKFREAGLALRPALALTVGVSSELQLISRIRPKALSSPSFRNRIIILLAEWSRVWADVLRWGVRNLYVQSEG
jgi:hypothetical protein